MSQYVTKIRTAQGDKQIDYNALANVPAISNPNLLINGDFQVWQRASSFQNHENAYCADRWNIRNANYSTYLVEKSSDVPAGSYMRNSMHIIEKNNANTYLQYHFDNALSGTYTLSFWYKSTVTFNTYLVDSGVMIHLCNAPATSEWTRVIYPFTASSLSRINLIQSLDVGECYITGVKLEVGTIATPFVPRLYAEELALCQRYYEKRTVVFFPYGGVTPTTYYLAVNGSDHRVTKCQLPKITASNSISDLNRYSLQLELTVISLILSLLCVALTKSTPAATLL